MHHLAFDKGWFEKHQYALIWLLNKPITKRWFRWVMRIRPGDCPRDEKIVRIEPNSITYGYKKKKGKIQLTTDFRTHWKYSKRLYHAFKPLWWMMHFWDWLIADRFIPQWSFGFDTLTANPQPNPETLTVDGYAARTTTSEMFSTIRGGVGTTANDSNTSALLQLSASLTSNQFNALYRSIFLFDTSALTAAATISAAVLSLFGANKANLIGSPELDIVASTPASNTALASGDYANLGTTVFGSVTYAGFSTSGYNDVTLDANGITNISKTGVSKFGARLNWDTDNSFGGVWSSGNYSQFIFSTADETGTSSDPKLTVTYTSTFVPKLIIF